MLRYSFEILFIYFLKKSFLLFIMHGIFYKLANILQLTISLISSHQNAC